jgi:hypothetical protein
MRVGGHLHAPAALTPGKRPGTHCIWSWVGPRAGLDGCEKYRPNRDSIPCPHSTGCKESDLKRKCRAALTGNEIDSRRSVKQEAGKPTHESKFFLLFRSLSMCLDGHRRTDVANPHVSFSSTSSRPRSTIVSFPQVSTWLSRTCVYPAAILTCKDSNAPAITALSSSRVYRCSYPWEERNNWMRWCKRRHCYCEREFPYILRFPERKARKTAHQAWGDVETITTKGIVTDGHTCTERTATGKYIWRAWWTLTN